MGKNSESLFRAAQEIIPGGVNSPVRAFRAVGGDPPFISRAAGSKIYDVDGNEYIDYVCSWGPMILGHAHPRVVEALKEAVGRGTSYGAPTELEVEMARLVVEAVPSIEMVRMVSSGTEATMSAIRLARGYTQRDEIIKFAGCYHGHGDSLLVKAGSGATTFGVPDSPGVPPELAGKTITLPYNNLEAASEFMNRRGEEIACIILEPVAGNMGVVPPVQGFLKGLEELCRKSGTLLIFDEVITGFRMGRGGAQELYGVMPDLTALGKIIGGGLPVGAYGGKKDIMEQISPTGPVYQAGTLSGNPLAMTAGIETLRELKENPPYAALEERAAKLCGEIQAGAAEAGVPTFHTRVGSMFCTFFNESEVSDYDSAKGSNTELFAKYFTSMLNEGINIAPSQFEAGFLSTAHTDRDLEKTVEVSRKSFKQL